MGEKIWYDHNIVDDGTSRRITAIFIHRIDLSSSWMNLELTRQGLQKNNGSTSELLSLTQTRHSDLIHTDAKLDQYHDQIGLKIMDLACSSSPRKIASSNRTVYLQG